MLLIDIFDGSGNVVKQIELADPRPGWCETFNANHPFWRAAPAEINRETLRSPGPADDDAQGNGG